MSERYNPIDHYPKILETRQFKTAQEIENGLPPSSQFYLCRINMEMPEGVEGPCKVLRYETVNVREEMARIMFYETPAGEEDHYSLQTLIDHLPLAVFNEHSEAEKYESSLSKAYVNDLDWRLLVLQTRREIDKLCEKFGIQ